MLLALFNTASQRLMTPRIAYPVKSMFDDKGVDFSRFYFEYLLELDTKFKSVQILND
jgi:hypothetical protein